MDMTINSLLYFGALAQLEFVMDAKTLNIEFHPYPVAKYIDLIKSYPNMKVDSMENDNDKFFNILKDRVIIQHLVDGKGNHMFMGYSRTFNTLVVCDDPNEEDYDVRKEYFEFLKRAHREEDPRFTRDECRIEVIHVGGTSHLCCADCGGRIVTVVKDKYPD